MTSKKIRTGLHLLMTMRLPKCSLICYDDTMGFMSDLNDFLNDVRAVGEELDAVKSEVVASVVELGRDVAGDAPAEPELPQEPGE